MEELILYYSPDPVAEARAQAVFAALHLPARKVAPTEVTQTVGYLAGFPGCAATGRPLVSPRLDAPMLVLCNVSRPRMDALFDAMRGAGVAPPDHKAILTPTNAVWTLADLYAELGREHRAMHGSS